MAAGKIFAISFAINAMMGASFATAMKQGGAVMQRLSEKTKNLNAEQKRLDKAWQESQNEIKGCARQMQQLQVQYDQGRVSESQYEASKRRIAQSMRQAGMSAEEYRGHLQRLKQEMEQTQAATKRLEAAQAGRMAAGAKVSAAWAGMKNVASITGMIASPFVGAIETAMDFEQAMSKVQAITRSNDTAMAQLTAKARELGETTQFSATQAAQAMSYLGMAGWDASQIIGGMPGLLALAAAGGTDLARTADIVSDDLTAFGLSADQAGHMADVFAVTVTRTNTNVEMLGETMKYAAPVAKAFGASMEETAALAGIMANSGIKASQAGTSLRAGFLRLAGPPKKSAKAMEELGISLSDAQAQQQEAQAALKSLGIEYEDFEGKPRKMGAILGELRSKTEGLSREQRLATLQAIFGTEAATGWLAVLDAGPETFDKLVTEMENCDGEAEKMAATMMNNARGAWTQFKSALEGAAISLGTIFLPVVTEAMKGMASTAGRASTWIKENEGLVKSVVELAGGVAAAAGAFKAYQMISGIFEYANNSIRLFFNGTLMGQKIAMVSAKGTAKAFSLLKTAINADTYRSFGLQVAGIFRNIGIRAAAVFGNMGTQAMACLARMRALKWEAIGDRLANSIGGATDRMGNAMERAAASMRSKWQAIADSYKNFSMADTAQSAGTAMQSKWQGVKQAIVTNMTAAQGTFARSAKSIKENALRAGESVAQMARKFSIGSAVSAAGNALAAMGSAITKVGKASLGAMFSPLGIALMAIAGAAYLIYTNWDKVGPFFMELWGRITQAFSDAWTMIQPALDQLGTAFSAMMKAFSDAWTALQPTFAQLGVTLGNLAMSIGPVLSQLGQTIMTAFSSIAGSGVFEYLIQAAQILATIFGGALIGAFIVFANVAVGAVTTAIGVVASVITGAIGVFTGLIQFITGVFTGDWTAAWNGIVNIFSSIFGTLGGIADSVLGGIKNTVNGIISSIKSVAGFGGGGKDISSNAQGGIYRKGAFLTTFAEEGPEAAIPLDGSQRAISLWQQAGQMLGIMPRARTAVPLQEKGGAITVPPAVVNVPQQESIAPIVQAPQVPAVTVPPAVVNVPQQESIAPIVQSPQVPAMTVPPTVVNVPQQESIAPTMAMPQVPVINLSIEKGDESNEHGFELPSLDIPKGLWIKAAELLGLNGGGDTITNTISNVTHSEQRADNSSLTAPVITINLTVNGNTDPGTIKDTVLDAGRQMQQTFAEQMEAFQRRKARLAY